ncbi:MAG: hypothetical protein HY908_12725 [Myxococcales bacterium]|nr:hypothetical protein [Myxococcales bacterium]
MHMRNAAWLWLVVAGCSTSSGETTSTATTTTTSPTCAPACDIAACETCDTSGATPACVPLCGAATECVAGACEPTPVATCEPVCGACQHCDTTLATPVCVGNCGPDLLCQDGACVAAPAVECAPACGPCEMCDTSGTPACVGLCGAGATCDANANACVSVASYHQALGDPGGPLHGPFASPYAVTATCIGCHTDAAAQVMATAHWTWAGQTPDLVTPNGTPQNPGDIGKVNLLNNFCVGVASNEKRCDQCHAGYGGDPSAAKAQKSARAYTSDDPVTGDSSIALASRIDCLVCHSNPTAGYAKDPKNFGLPTAAVNLAVAAQDVRKPTRSNCGACHFYAGGGDSVKLMGSSLKNPSEAIDVHMGRGMECADCHASAGHVFRGGGIHTPTHTARTSCSDCHTLTPHEGVVPSNGQVLDDHTATVSCQTCHIPKFSRGQFTKMDWNWSTAGDNQTCAGTPGTCVAGVVSIKVADDGVTPDPSAAVAVTSYDYVKGNFVWKKNVVPAYRWYNQKGTHATTADRVSYGSLGTTPADDNRISLGEPQGAPGDGLIMPFKLMRGRQAFYIDGAQSFPINPNMFGPGSFWGVIQAPGYQYAAYDFDAGGPVAPGQPSVDALWGRILANGAVAAGQQPSGTPPMAPWLSANPAVPGYDWRYTKLYLDLNHEVAPKAQALGAAGCTDCHSAAPRIPMCELYAGTTPPWGVVCP